MEVLQAVVFQNLRLCNDMGTGLRACKVVTMASGTAFERRARSFLMPVGHGVHWRCCCMIHPNEYHRLQKCDLLSKGLTTTNWEVHYCYDERYPTYRYFSCHHSMRCRVFLLGWSASCDAEFAVTASTRVELGLPKARFELAKPWIFA